MITLRKAFDSTVGRKYIMGFSGIALMLFVVVHLLGNLNLFFPEGTHFNAYAEKLHSFGPLLTLSEVGLAAVILLHAFYAVRVTLSNKSARPEKYAVYKSKGDPSRSNVASRNMIITGLVIFGFLILHIWQFRFGPGMDAGYVAQIGDPGATKDVRDLYRLVSEVFHQPLFVGIYVAVMVFLGMHFRHGFWSAFQSLGAMSKPLSKPIYTLGAIAGALLALGFLMIPIWFYFDLGAHLS
jgi:succinate dehydrogenase / fumarate reductase cytochrome b subunit